MAPIDLDLVEPSMLTREERDWLNTYHAQVRAAVAAAMSDADNHVWLQQATGRFKAGCPRTSGPGENYTSCDVHHWASPEALPLAALYFASRVCDQ